MLKYRQINIGQTQRNALFGIEIHIHCRKPFSDYSEADLYQLSLLRREFFKDRFGFSARKQARHDVLAIQQQYEFSDEEIKTLRQAGVLAIYAKSAAIKPSAWMKWAGYYQLAVMAPLALLAILQIILSSAPAWRQALGLMVIAVIAAILYIFITRTYLLPGKILKKAGISCAADVKPLPETA
jgi:hypothetical protein